MASDAAFCPTKNAQCSITSLPNFWAYHRGGPLLQPNGCGCGPKWYCEFCMGWLRFPEMSGQAHWFTTAAPPSSLTENEPKNANTLSFNCRWAARFFLESRASYAGSTFTCRPM